MADGHNFNDLARRIEALPNLLKPGDLSKVYTLLEGLRELPFPPGYLDELREDMFKALMRGKRVSTYVYLSFYGLDEQASHLKIGIAKSVKARMANIKCGNPLPRLWTWATRFPSRDHAALVEASLLGQMASARTHGEWVNVHGVKESAAGEIVRSLTETATEVIGYPVEFERHEG